MPSPLDQVGPDLSDAPLFLVLFNDALERVTLRDRKPILSIVIDALNDDLVLAIVLNRSPGQDDRRRPPRTDWSGPEIEQVLAIVDDQRPRVSGLPALPPSSGAAVNRTPHQQPVGKELFEEPDNVVGDSRDRFICSAFLVVRIEEVVVNDGADGK